MSETVDQKTILVIDDDPSILTIVSSILRTEFRVLVAKNGEEGLRLAEKDPQPSLIFLDFLMPNMHGDEVCRTLKRRTFTRDIPVVFLTGDKAELTQSYLIGFGAVDYIKKPIDGEFLLQRARLHTSTPAR